MKVLIVEDDEIIREGLKFALLQENYEVLSAAGVSEALEQIQNCRDIGFYLLDIMLPDGDGYQVCREIRKNSSAPILFLTACEDEVHTVMALEQGADDYICKPFRIRELLARMKAILRRTSAQGGGLEQIVQVGKNQVNLQTGRVYSDKDLLILLNHRGQTLSRSQILEGIWDEAGDFVNDNTLSVYMKRLRKKLGDTADGQIIRTVRGIGYRME